MKKHEEAQKYVTESQFGLFIEQMNEQFERVLEAVGSQTEKIPKMSERIERLESDVNWVRLNTSGVSGDLDLLKIRSERIQDTLDLLQVDLKISHQNHERRLTKLEASKS